MALLTQRLTKATRTADGPLPADQVRAIIHQAVHDARSPATPLSPAPSQAVDPRLAEAHHAVQELIELSEQAGQLFLEIAPAYLSEDQAAEHLAALANAIGQDLPTVLAQRRYALTGDRRALAGTVL